MIAALRKLIRPQPARPLASVPPGERVYAVGDVHGRRDLFDALIAAIEADDAARGLAETTIVLLGDLVDRGPDSSGVIRAARRLADRRKVRILCGNHEEMFLRSFDDVDSLRHFLRYGGLETALSYPIPLEDWNAATLEEAKELLWEAVPLHDMAFLESFEDWVVIGDYLFVHAGVEPGVPIDQQRTSALRWIRQPFLSHGSDHGHVVVHGHSIEEEPVFRSNRIGIDTGAYASGRLTALGLEGAARWLIATDDSEGDISTEIRQV